MPGHVKALWKSCKGKMTKPAVQAGREPLPPHVVIRIGEQLAATGGMKTLARLMLLSKTTSEALQEMLYRDVTIKSPRSARIFLSLLHSVPSETILDLGNASPRAGRHAKSIISRRLSTGVEPAHYLRTATRLGLIRTITWEDVPFDSCWVLYSMLKIFIELDPNHRLRPLPNLENMIVRNLGTEQTEMWMKMERRFYAYLGAVLRPPTVCIVEDVNSALLPPPRNTRRRVSAFTHKASNIAYGARRVLGKSLEIHHHICVSHAKRHRRCPSRSDAASLVSPSTIGTTTCQHCKAERLAVEGLLFDTDWFGSPQNDVCVGLLKRLRLGEVLFSGQGVDH